MECPARRQLGRYDPELMLSLPFVVSRIRRLLLFFSRIQMLLLLVPVGNLPAPGPFPVFHKDAWAGLWGVVGHTHMQCVSWSAMVGFIEKERWCVSGELSIW